MMNGKLKRAREKRLMTQEELAKSTGISVTSISRIENGAHKPRFSTVKKLAAALGVEPERLIERAKE